MRDLESAVRSLLIAEDNANKSKGIPVPYTGRLRWHSSKDSGKTGVIGSARVLYHRYMDEGDKGKGHNRHIKRLERAMWLSEWQEEQNENAEYGYERDVYDVSGWFSESLVCPEDYGDMMDMWQNSPCGCRD